MAEVSEVVRKIKKKTRCYLLREGRNHEIWSDTDTGKEFQIPQYHSKGLPKGTADSIMKDTGLL